MYVQQRIIDHRPHSTVDVQLVGTIGGTVIMSPIFGPLLAACSSRSLISRPRLSRSLVGENMADTKHASKCPCGEVEVELVGRPMASLHVSYHVSAR